MPASAELALEALGKRYDQALAVDGVTLAVPSGTYVVLLGPSGSGKTTVLSMIGGFTAPSSGRVLIGGVDVTPLPPARRPTATVFQDYALFPHLSVEDNVGFGLSVRGVAKDEIRTRTAAALRTVGLEGFGPRGIAATSGGQRQRIALARALITEPSVLLLDEPLGALDLTLRRQMQDELRHIQRSQGRTFVHVTHDQEEAMAIADLVVLMNRGRIEDVGPPARVYARPRTRFAAQFFGESSLLDGTVVACRAGRVMVETPCGRLEAAGERSPGDRVTLAIRPEAVRLGEGGGGDQVLGRLEIEDRVFQGGFVRLRGVVTGGLRLLAKVPPEAVDTARVSVPVCVAPDGLVLLED